MTHDDIEMATTWPALLPPEKVVLTVWEHGLSVESHSYGSFMIHGSQMKSVSMYDGNSMTQVALLSIVLRPNATLREQLPPHLLMDFDQMGQCQILLAVSPHSKAHTQLYGSVLPQWKDNSQVPEVERPECLDGELWPVHSFLQHKLDSVSKGAVTPLKKVACTTPELFDYLQHLSMSSCLRQPINRDVFHSLTSETQKTKDYDKIIVTIITGTPGSEKERLGTLLTTYNKNVINWLVYKQPEECRVDSNFLYRSMTSAVESRNQWKLTKITRVIFIAPGFCDTSAVVGALQTHPNPNVRSEFIVGAVTVCIDPLNTFMVHNMTLPAVTAHCAQGWVNNIVFTSQTQAPSELLDHIQMLVRSINSNVALLKAENGEVKRSTDLDLIMSDSAFQEPEFEKARLLMKPVGALGRPQVWPCQPVMNDVMLRFTQPLEKHLTLIKLRNIKSSLKSHPFEGNIYYVRGYLAFSGSPTLVDLQFTPLSGKLSMVDSQSSRGAGEGTVYIISFTGVKLKEAELKTFLEACVKQKPQKKKLLTRSDLTKKDIDKVHSEHHLDELPEGWFYNGSQFVSMTGERSLKHPSLESFVQEFLDRKNADIEKFNARVDSEEYVNLFP
ncbi:uncharacterized protein C20orf194 isoform X2 [Aplysia californica]|nr:uncharacterized protein C20orf194 isoform X2 [Aplysia californica]